MNEAQLSISSVEDSKSGRSINVEIMIPSGKDHARIVRVRVSEAEFARAITTGGKIDVEIVRNK